MDALTARPEVARRALALPRVLADERVLVAVLFACALAVRIVFAVTVPPWQGPDEPAHFEYVRLLVDKRAQLWAEGRILGPRDASPALQGQIIASLARYHYWEYVGWLPSGPTTPAVLPTNFAQIWPGKSTQLHRPSLYHFAAALALLPFAGADVESQLLALRLFSALLSALTVLVVYRTARESAPGDAFVAPATAAFVAALPMHIFIGGTVNPDNLVTLLGSLVAWGLALNLRRGLSIGRLALLAVAFALALLAKRTAVAYLPALALLGAWGLASLRGRRLLPAGAAFALGAALVAVVWLGGYAQPLRLAEVWARLSPYATNGSAYLAQLARVSPASPAVQALIARQLAALFASFWGIFGWFNVLLGLEMYVGFALLSGLCALGFLAWLGRGAGAGSTLAKGQRAVGLLFLLVAGTLVALSVVERIGYLSPHELPQGRYLFAVVAPIAVIHAVGARALLPERRFGTGGPLVVVCLVLAAVDLIVYVGCLLPYYVWRTF